MSDSAGVSVRPGDGELAGLRAELDGVDDRLLDTIRERIEICTRIAVVKRRHSIPVVQPHRMGAVHEHARSYAARHDLSPQFLRAVYDLLIAETCRVEDRVIAEAAPGSVLVPESDRD
ncbi:chorismate mutase family protein [Rhodococcus sp. NPDC054953]